MDDPAATAKQLVDLARKHIEDHQRRIAQQRELVAKYERDDDVGRLSGARRVLEPDGEAACSHDGGSCSGRRALVTVDEPSIEKFV